MARRDEADVDPVIATRVHYERPVSADFFDIAGKKLRRLVNGGIS